MSTITATTPAPVPAVAEVAPAAPGVPELVHVRVAARRPYLVLGVIGWGALAVRALAAVA